MHVWINQIGELSILKLTLVSGQFFVAWFVYFSWFSCFSCMVDMGLPTPLVCARMYDHSPSGVKGVNNSPVILVCSFQG